MLEWLSLERHETRVGEDVEKEKPCALFLGMSTGATITEDNTEFLQKIKNGTTI